MGIVKNANEKETTFSKMKNAKDASLKGVWIVLIMAKVVKYVTKKKIISSTMEHANYATL